MRDHLETIRRTKATLHGGNLEWRDVVALARDSVMHNCKDHDDGHTHEPTHKHTGHAHQPAQGGGERAHLPRNDTSSTAGTQGSGAPPKKRCAYCSPLGLGMDSHDEKWCYINPASPVYKEDVRARKISQAKKKGTQLPDYLQDEVPKKVNMVASVENSGDGGLAEDILGALRMVGSLSEDEVQGHLDRILNEH